MCLLLVEGHLEVKQEPNTNEDDCEANPDLAHEQTKNSNLESNYDMACPDSESIIKDALMNCKMHRSKKAIRFYSSPPDVVRVTTSYLRNNKNETV